MRYYKTMSADIDKFLNEAITVTGVLARPSSVQGYVNLFFTMLSPVSRSYKKETDPKKYENGCGRIYSNDDASKKSKYKVSYTLLQDIVITKKKVVYTLTLDIDSQNAVIQYRQYKNKMIRPQYLAIMLAKKNIIANLKNAGFTIKTDQNHIYATAPNFIMEPGTMTINGQEMNFGNLVMNDYQKKMLDIAKTLFTFEEVYPGQNQYSILLKNVKTKVEVASKDRNVIFAPDMTFSKAIIMSNGIIKLPKIDTDGTSSMVPVYSVFEPITLD